MTTVVLALHLQVMVVTGGVNQTEDLNDVWVWRRDS
jgi:hypothetical protein